VKKTSPEHDWPPSLEHIAIHEAGHAVLQHEYGSAASIRVEADAMDGGKTWGGAHAAKAFCESVLQEVPPFEPLPTEEQLGEVLSIYLAGEAAFHIWSQSLDDTDTVVENWEPARHELLIDTDGHHRETYLACKIALHFFYGDIGRTRTFVVQRQHVASDVLRGQWLGVQSLAAGVLSDYRQKRINRALQHSDLIDYGLLTAPKVSELLQAASAKRV
jgi:hypothetical protein